MKPYTMKQLLGMVFVLAIGVCVLFSCGCSTTPGKGLRAGPDMFPEYTEMSPVMRAFHEVHGDGRPWIKNLSEYRQSQRPIYEWWAAEGTTFWPILWK